MQRILSNLLTFFIAGLVIMTFLYVASIVIPILLLVVVGFFGWMKFKHKKIMSEWNFYEKQHRQENPKDDIIDVEYEVVDDNKHQRWR